MGTLITVNCEARSLRVLPQHHNNSCEAPWTRTMWAALFIFDLKTGNLLLPWNWGVRLETSLTLVEVQPWAWTLWLSGALLLSAPAETSSHQSRGLANAVVMPHAAIKETITNASTQWVRIERGWGGPFYHGPPLWFGSQNILRFYCLLKNSSILF